MRRRPPERKPSFMKILVEHLPNKLLIPPKFVRLHRGTLARKFILRPTGTQDSWPEPITSQNVGSQKESIPILPNQEKKADLKTQAMNAAKEFMASSEFPTFNRIMKSAYMRFGGFMVRQHHHQLIILN
ncbi:hypothetical protein POM88_029550 [Heracleum sosnowskyi]|uniref:Uncharacterized protein n=1 Tax=Heracleum sosnowskyi TaxID=360622 RepID=A0AAD8HTV8_9APIA|nr:hypothetical protein POM88_029550 [Heracleum sosnowskyi]